MRIFDRLRTMAWLAAASAAGAWAQSSWTVRHPTGADCPVSALIWTGSQFLAVGDPYGPSPGDTTDESVILTSPDGKAWTRRKAGVGVQLRAVISTGKLFVAVGGGYPSSGPLRSAIITSADGADWTASYPDSLSLLQGAVWTGSLAVVVGSRGAIRTSPDGLNWTRRVSGTSKDLLAVTWTGTELVAVGPNDSVLTSPDGINWTPREFTSGDHMTCVTWTGSQLVGGGRDIYTSPDGVAWTRRTFLNTQAHLSGIAASGDRIVAVGESTYSSSDGAAWTVQAGAGSAVAWDGNRFLSIGGPNSWSLNSNAVRSSPDGTAWTLIIQGMPRSSKRWVTWTGKRLIALEATVFSGSTDGVSWDHWAPTYQNGFFDQLPDMMDWAKDRLFAQGYGLMGESVTCTSVDGKTWTRISIERESLLGVAWTGKRFVGVGRNGYATYSEDGNNWTGKNLGLNSNLNAVAWTGDRLVAVGDSGVAMTSPDGTEWTDVATGVTVDLVSVASRNGRLVAVGKGGTVITSPDGLSWTARNSGTANNLRDVDWTHASMVAVGEYGTLITSPDGVDWTKKDMGIKVHLNGVVGADSLYVAVGDFSTIMTSPVDAPVNAWRFPPRPSVQLRVGSSNLYLDLPYLRSGRHRLGVFGIGGGRFLEVESAGGETAIPISGLPRGRYVLKACGSGTAYSCFTLR